MAPSIALDQLPPANKKPLRILDPMAGSGTTLVVARSRGHHAIGFDTDPLACLISKVWCTDIDDARILSAAHRVGDSAEAEWRTIPLRDAYPLGADEETKQFVRYWFDGTNRRQLCALSNGIRSVRAEQVRSVLWCALSRLIIAKARGASYAMDLAHSRPHKVLDKPAFRPLPNFLHAVDVILKAAPFPTHGTTAPPVAIHEGDARSLALPDASIDVAITSPPYLNAIDYVRCNKFSLVWMGHHIPALRRLRSENIGTESTIGLGEQDKRLRRAVNAAGDVARLPERDRRMLCRYVEDMDAVVSQLQRVIVRRGRCVFVIGDCSMRGVFVKNSEIMRELAHDHGFQEERVVTRPLPDDRRYLPPPSSQRVGINLGSRMRQEIVLSLVRR